MIKYVLWDEVIDWERDIKDYGKKSEEIKGQSECGSASTKVYKAHFGVQKRPKNLKEASEKRITAVFRKRGSAKIAVFSVFKSVNLLSKSDDTDYTSARRRRALV